jgi:hypothetical protein
LEANFTLLSELRAAAGKDEAYPKSQAAAEQLYGVGSKYREGLVWIGEQLCVPNSLEVRTRLIAECHDTPTGGHFGRDKTIEMMKKRFQWKGMAVQVSQYVMTCDTCQRTKHSRQRTNGLLMPLPVPEEIDDHWTMDFVTGLPKTERGNDTIQGHFSRGGSIKRLVVARTTDTASDIAQRYMDSVVRHHGVPKSIVSDRDPRLMKGFWRALMEKLGTKLDPSTSHHPQSDGKSERDQQTMEQYLRAFCEERPKDWDLMLGLCELAMNSVPHAASGVSAYKLLYGREPATSVDRALQQDDKETTASSSDGVGQQALIESDAVLPAAEARWKTMQEAWTKARGDLLSAQQRMAVAADRHRREQQFKVGDLVLLSTEHLKLRDGDSTRKLTPLFCGPFPIKRVVNRNAYELELPELFEIHPTINISQLRPYRDGRTDFPHRPAVRSRPPPDAIDSNGQESYVVERVLAHKGGGAGLKYLVLWQGYGFEEATWEPAASLLVGAKECVNEYKRVQSQLPQHAKTNNTRRGRRRALAPRTT